MTRPAIASVRTMNAPASRADPAEPAERAERVDRADRAHNLPHLASSFVGRAQEVARVAELLAGARLVTLTGPGGMGKTRLAVEVALGLVPGFAGGVWLVELAPLSEPAVLAETVAAVLPGAGTAQARARPGRWSTDQVAAHIGDRPLLLVLDNCEHLLDAAGQFADQLLRACPAVRVLATSREPLRLDGEHRWPVGPLPAAEAEELFRQRAVAAAPDFSLTDAVAPTVAEICRRLDGMPLALELAAARLASLSAVDVLERLDNRFRLLTAGSRTAAARHQTLAAALEWSHDQLVPAEAAVLRRASVFAGWGLSAAEAVCGWGDVEPEEVFERLTALAGKSLVVVERPDDRVRYSLLETIRAWARDKLDAAGEAEETARRHAAWCLELAEKAHRELAIRRPQVWLDRLDAEHDNLRAALEWSRASGAAGVGVDLVNALTTFWRMRGHLGEGLGWLEWAIGVLDDCPPLTRATALRGAGLFRGMTGDLAGALPLLEESSALFAEAGDHDASVCACHSMFHMFRNPRQSLPGLGRDIELCRSTRDANKLAHFLWALGQAHFLLGELTIARGHFEECVTLGRDHPDGEAMRSGLFGLGRIAALVGDPAAAEAAFEEARAHAESLADVDHLAIALVQLADLSRARGDWDRAARLLDESMALTNPDGTPVDEARGLYFAARLAEAEAADGEGDNGAGELFGEALTVARMAGGLGFHEIRCLLGMGWASAANGDRSGATGQLLEALATAQAIGDAQAMAQALDRLGRLARVDGRPEEADTLARRGLALHHSVGDVAGLASSLESLGGLAIDGQRWQIGARLLAAGQALLDAAGYVRSRRDQARYERDLGLLRDGFDEGAMAAALAEGMALSADEAVAYANRPRGRRDRPVSGWDSLTPAEREVVQMVGQGLTNPEVGRRLFISPRTVGHHLAHVYQKLGIHSRAALIKELAGRESERE